jgi:ElaB/YqjD/DUF883 family membrane-anchored ribosome-binding protein
MANGMFSSRGKSLRKDLHSDAQSAQKQIAELREEIASLTRLLGRDASDGAAKVKSKAKAVHAQARNAADTIKDHVGSDFGDLIGAGEEFLSDLQHRYRDSGRKVRETVRERPLATLGIAVAAGVILASLLRR